MVDRRYGTGNKYGNGRLYGASNAPIVDDRFRWGVMVNWDSSYGEDNEANYMTHLYVFRGRRNFLNPNGKGFAPIETGRARVTLDNSDGRYDGWNTSSPLYPNVAPGKDIRIRIRDLDSGTTYDVFTGVVLDIETIGYGANAKVVLVCEDYWYYLRNQFVLYKNDTQQNATIDVIIKRFIFNNELHPFFSNFIWQHGFNIETSSDTIPFWWSSNDVLIGDMLNDLSQSHFGKFFIAADGKATYYDRGSARASVQTYTQSQMLKDIGNFQPWVNQRNSMRIKVRNRKQAAGVSLWNLSESIQILEGATLEIATIFTYNNAVVPTRLITTFGNLSMNTASDGSGTDLTSSLLFSFVTLGDVAICRLTNNSASDGYITDLEWTGNAIYETGTLDVAYPPNTPPQVRELLIDSVWHQSISKATTLLSIYGSQIAAVRQFPIISFDTRAEALVPDLFDIVTVGIAKLGISNTQFEVGGIEIETTNETCQAFTVRQYLEPHFTA